MDFYEVINRRHTIRDFADREVPGEVVERILGAGLKAPTNNHLREWEFVVLRGREHIATILAGVAGNTEMQLENVRANADMDKGARAMYLEAVPKQVRMLSDSGCLILPFYRQRGDLLRPAAQNALNAFAGAWCCIENILLAATAEGLGCSLRVPVGDEPAHVGRHVKAPEGYVMPCYIGLGYPAEDAAAVEQPTIDIKARIHSETW